MSESDLLSVFEGIPQAHVKLSQLKEGIEIIQFSTEVASAFNSNGEARRMIQNNGVSINKSKVGLDFVVDQSQLLLNKYILLQKGKKNYYLIHLED